MSRKVVMQQYDGDDAGLYSLATFHTLRIEALDLFDRSLAEGNVEYLERFIEQQVAQEPPPLELLSQVAEDVHQRLLNLQQLHFDARDGMRRTLEHQYGFDITPFLSIDPLDYHRLNVEEALNFSSPQQSRLTEENRIMLRQILQEALASAAQLYEQMALAEKLYTYLRDWLMGLHIVSIRGAWSEDFHPPEEHPIQ